MTRGVSEKLTTRYIVSYIDIFVLRVVRQVGARHDLIQCAVKQGAE